MNGIKEYPIGAEAVIRKTSEFRSQQEGIGQIKSVKDIHGTPWYQVKWPTGYQNNYRYIDLEVVRSDNETHSSTLPLFSEYR